MTRWHRLEDTWILWPSKPIGLIEMIGGSYLATTPHICYRRLLEGLSKKNLAIHTWSYIPNFDHQLQANQAWRDFRKCRKELEEKFGYLPLPIRVGHSLGCKLHLLAPDGGRSSSSMVALSFNNYSATQSIPGLRRISQKFGFYSEFSPSPSETINLINKRYIQPRNLLLQFNQDNLDQSKNLLISLKSRPIDNSKRLIIEGDHLTPASAGLRQNLIGEWADDLNRSKRITQIIETIFNWSCSNFNL